MSHVKSMIMKGKVVAKEILVTLIVAFVVNIVITLLWNYFVKDRGLVVDWGPSIRIALLLALVIPLSRAWGK